MAEWTGSFEWRGVTGRVDVECIANDDPVGYGSMDPDAHGFPVCSATVHFPTRGYNAMFGWVQLVRSTDNESAGARFEVDPFALFADARSPYCWYGTEPTLFDAPSRRIGTPMEWLAYSFLATTPLDELFKGNPRCVVPVFGFAWGFDIGFDIRGDAPDAVELRDIVPLTSNDWEAQLPVLRAEYPSPVWTFADSF